MTPEDLLVKFRAQITDTALPCLWSDEEVYAFMDDAQKQFCRLTGGISDATSDITQISVDAGEEFVAIDPRVLKIRYAKRLSDNQALALWNFEDMNQPSDLDDYGMKQTMKFDDKTGPIKGLILGMERHKVRCMPIPEVAETIALIVYRIPLLPVTETSQELEIEEQHHQYLVYWMMKLAYEKQDAEAFDRGKANEMEKKFLAYCAEARHERELREHKYRAVAYGGI